MEKNHQELYVRLLAAFLLLVLFLTFYSKTFYNAHLPTVTVARPQQGELDHSVEGSGRVTRAEEKGQWKAELLLDEAAADMVDAQSRADIDIKGRMGKLEGRVAAVDFYQKEDGTQGYRITIAFACEDEGLEGKKANVRLWKTEEAYDGIVPSNALHKDRKGYYLWTVQEVESVLGDFYAVKRASVDFLDSDSSHSAVMGITEGMVIIVDGPENLCEGDKVKYVEG